MVRSDARAHEAERRRQAIEQVDLDRRVGGQQVPDRVEPGRATADDGDAQGVAHAGSPAGPSRTGSVRSWFTKPETTCRGSPASSICG